MLALSVSCLIFSSVLGLSHEIRLERGDQCGIEYGIPGRCELLYDCIQAMSDFEQGIKPELCGFDGKMPIVCCKERLARISSSAKYCFKSSLHQLRSRFKPLNDTFESKNFNVNTAQAIGGSLSEKQEFPHMAALGYGDKDDIKWMCGGSLVNEQFVLTAAHCLVSNEMGPVKYVRLGDLNLYSNTDSAQPQDFTIARTYKHPGYIPPDKYHDLAIIKLDRPAIFTDWVRPACLHYDPDMNDEKLLNVTLMATGWGFTEEYGNPADHLVKVDLDLFSTAECSKIYKPQRTLSKGIQHEYMLCAGGRTKEKGTCLGDSGGPLQKKTDNINGQYTIIGITSFGRGCAYIGTAGVYVRVSRYLPWIENIVWSHNGGRETSSAFSPEPVHKVLV